MLSVRQFLTAMSAGLNSQTSDEIKTAHREFLAHLVDSKEANTFENAKTWAFANLWYDHNTPTNQDIKRRMIDREDFLCQSSLVEAILSKWDNDLFTWDDVNGGENYNVELSYGWWEGNENERDAKIEELRGMVDDFDSDETNPYKLGDIENDIKLLENADSTREVFEWWVCSSWMIEKLKEQGEAILSTDYGDWWGRQCSGQAILLDGVMSRIAFDMEILEYQANDWSKK